MTGAAYATILRRADTGDAPSMQEVRIAVIGAGIAGLACAQELARADAKVTVFERSRGLGGRLATRRVLSPRPESGSVSGKG